MEFLSQVDSQVSNNGEVIDCSNLKSRPLSSRCVVRQSTIIEPNTEVIVPVPVHRRCTNLDLKASKLGMRYVGALSQLTFATKGPLSCKNSGGF